MEPRKSRKSVLILSWNLLPVVTLALLIVGQLSLAQEHRAMSDAQIKEVVEHYLTEEGILKGNVAVAVNKGVVTLSGMVPSAWAKARAVELAFKAPDVVSVQDELKTARGESDSELAEKVASQIRRYVFYDIYDDVEIEVKDGVVTLHGRVTMPFKAQEIAQLASRIPGVQSVKNNIKVLPVSISDQQLREQIASQIYRAPMFWEYANRTNPPIHIIVENGRVTLTGAVRSEVEKRKAESIARSVFGVFSVENKLQTASKT
jgi:hyperosmotically inducible protein